jgi:hypothetical protein
VTPETVDVTTIKLLRRAFDVVIGVELIGQEDEKGLKLLGECSFSPDKFFEGVKWISYMWGSGVTMDVHQTAVALNSGSI